MHLLPAPIHLPHVYQLGKYFNKYKQSYLELHICSVYKLKGETFTRGQHCDNVFNTFSRGQHCDVTFDTFSTGEHTGVTFVSLGHDYLQCRNWQDQKLNGQ